MASSEKGEASGSAMGLEAKPPLDELLSSLNIKGEDIGMFLFGERRW
jgi:hypothetical protein